MKKYISVLTVFLMNAGIFSAHVEKVYTPENTIVAWDFHDVIVRKPIGAMVWESVNIIKDAPNRWQIIKLLFSPSFINELWTGLEKTKSGDRMIAEMIALFPNELAQHKDKIFAVANMHHLNCDTIEIMKQLKKLGFIQVLASNIGGESLSRMKQKYPELFLLFDGLFYDGALNKKGERYTFEVKPKIEYYQSLKDFVDEHFWDEARIIFIDDRKDNIDAAHHAHIGIDAVQFKNTDQLRKDLKKRGINLEKYNESMKMQTAC